MGIMAAVIIAVVSAFVLMAAAVIFLPHFGIGNSSDIPELYDSCGRHVYYDR